MAGQALHIGERRDQAHRNDKIARSMQLMIATKTHVPLADTSRIVSGLSRVGKQLDARLRARKRERV